MAWAVGTSTESGDTPTMTRAPFLPTPPSAALIAWLLVTVARITRAPPSAWSASATFWALLSM